MASSKPSTAQEHYENLLADHYEWMFGLPFEAKVAEQKAISDEFVGKDLAGGLAVDIGCGPGYQSVALSERGYKVLAIDTSEKLLRNLSARVGPRNIVTKHADAIFATALLVASETEDVVTTTT
jgi:2-polyprenyl-3-methyl-5-hydroxy-6-metoxy-1,4-benzoquinol methylase